MFINKMNIPFLSLKDVTAKYVDEIHEAVHSVVDSGWYLQGNENERFEANYAKYISTKHCIGCANGLDALIWIFRAYKEMGVMQPGDEVIVPASYHFSHYREWISPNISRTTYGYSANR